jgi:hypothetical protein
MSELFACLKEQVVGYSDMFAEHLLDECIELWASILEASARKGRASIFPPFPATVNVCNVD